MGHENLKARKKTFALDVVCLCTDLPRRKETTQALGQLHRCARSAGASSRAACRAQSAADFIAKLGTVEDEADESAFWLGFIEDLNLRRHFKSYRHGSGRPGIPTSILTNPGPGQGRPGTRAPTRPELVTKRFSRSPFPVPKARLYGASSGICG